MILGDKKGREREIEKKATDLADDGEVAQEVSVCGEDVQAVAGAEVPEARRAIPAAGQQPPVLRVARPVPSGGNHEQRTDPVRVAREHPHHFARPNVPARPSALSPGRKDRQRCKRQEG
jgi:hypothetical protein